MASTRTRARLLVFLLVFLSLPALQQISQLIKSGSLSGDFAYAPDTVFTWKGWFDGRYQEKKTAFINDHIGFRPDLVRFNNQLDWSLFNNLHVRNVVIGTDGYLYEKAYVQVYVGFEFSGTREIEERLVKIKALQDTFLKMNKRILFVFAPSQARYYPDHFPVGTKYKEGDPTLYNTNIRIADSLNVEYLDFNGWFEGLRGHTDHLLFSKVGVHWTRYGALMAADSITHYLERVDHIDMPDLVIDKIVTTNVPANGEQDIADGMNLIFPLLKEHFSRPEYHFNEDGKVKPKIIYMGDSFLWPIMANRTPHSIGADFEFWYYAKQVLNEHSIGTGGEEQPLTMDSYDWGASLDNAQYVILMYTEANLWKVGDGFIDKIYARYFGNKDPL